ncbi:MAG: hypothetical protein QMD46_10365 [Methanomicrobiales archaeon]|nr:hypothetical protein [Methanomicrobiales archaeon]MDI6877072.1 hypothetical protein [Methanomicrobiales archaeon]
MDSTVSLVVTLSFVYGCTSGGITAMLNDIRWKAADILCLAAFLVLLDIHNPFAEGGVILPLFDTLALYLSNSILPYLLGDALVTLALVLPRKDGRPG